MTPWLAKNAAVATGYAEPTTMPSAELGGALHGHAAATASVSVQRPKPRGSSSGPRHRASISWLRPAIAASTAPSWAQTGMSSLRANSTSMSHCGQCVCSARPVVSTSMPHSRASRAAGSYMRPLDGRARRNGRLTACAASPAGRARSGSRPRRGAASGRPAVTVVVDAPTSAATRAYGVPASSRRAHCRRWLSVTSSWRLQMSRRKRAASSRVRQARKASASSSTSGVCHCSAIALPF